MYVVVFVGGFVGVGCRHALDMLLPSVSGTPFVVGTFVSNMVACFLFAMLTEFMATASWLRRRVRQVVSRGVGLGLLGGLSTMSGVMLETMEGLHERHIASALGYLAGNFAGGLLTAAAGVVLMQALLSRSTRKRVRGAFSAVSVSDSAESDTQGVRHVKVADVARSAARRNGSRADGPADCTDGTGSASRNTNRAADRQPAYADRPRSADSSAGRSSAGTAIAAVAARAGYFRLGQLPEPIQQSQPIQQPQQQSQPIQQPANPLPPSFEPKPITAEISLIADPATGRCADDVDDLSVRRSWRHGPLRARRVNSTRLESRESENEPQLPAIHARHQRRRLAMRGHRMMSYYSQSVDMDTVMMFVVGFLGGFSTFSTALNEVVSLIRQRRFTLALGYGIATVAVPLICVAAGFGIALLANPA